MSTGKITRCSESIFRALNPNLYCKLEAGHAGAHEFPPDYPPPAPPIQGRVAVAEEKKEPSAPS